MNGSYQRVSFSDIRKTVSAGPLLCSQCWAKDRGELEVLLEKERTKTDAGT